MNWTSVEASFEYTDNITVWDSSNGNWSHNASNNTSTFTPTIQFDHSTEYWISVNVTASDTVGNPLDQNMNGAGGEWPDDVLAWNFTTEMQDIAPPFALNWNPNGTHVPTDSVIQIVWNETMNWTSVEAAFSYTDGILNYSSANGTWLHDDSTNTSIFTPADDWAHETRYNVTVNCTASDIVGNLLDQDWNGTGGYWPDDVLEWNFTTVDETPYVVSTSPANNQVDVDPSAPIIIRFSEAMNQSSVEESFSYTNGTITWNTGNGTEHWNAGGTEFTFSPIPILERNQTFAVNINGSMARDIGGRIIGNNHSWSFTTWLEPPPPHVTDTYPPSGAINVPVNTYINLGFDVEMDILAVQDAFSYTDGTDTWNAADGTVDWFSGNTLFSFQPEERLRFESTYTVRLDTNATSTYGKTLDGNDNGVSETNDDFVFTFSTGPEPPTVVSHYPGVDQAEIPTTLSAIYINFSRPMDTISVTNGVSIYPNTNYMPSFSPDQKNLTLVLNDELLRGAQYRITVMGTATDTAGTKLDGNDDGAPGDKFTYAFITEGAMIIERPEIVNVWPANNATIPADGIFIAITFNQAMNRTSVENAFSFKNSSHDINGTFAWSVTGKTVRFTPQSPLEFNGTYFARISGNAKSANGLALGNATSWQYITEGEEAPASLGDILLYGVIIVLLALTVMLYMANRSLRMEVRKNRVMLKRAMKRSGLTEEELKKSRKAPATEEQPGREMPEDGPPEDEMEEPEALEGPEG